MCYKEALRYRNVWLGVAMVWIVLFHCTFRIPISILNYIKNLGYGGVDICLFASGIGCYYSLNTKPDTWEFIKRRLKRIFPTYLIFIVFWLVYKFFIGEFGIRMALGNVLAVQQFTGHENAFNWYISAILLFYFLAPYIKRFIDESSDIAKFLFLVFLIVFSIPFWEADMLIVIVTRLPIFYIGMLFHNISQRALRVNKKHVFVMFAMFGIGFIIIALTYIFKLNNYMWPYGLFWYPFILITVPMCIAISYVARFLEKNKFTKKIVSFLELCGSYSFEIYLIHIPLVEIISGLIKTFNLGRFSFVLWVIGLFVLVVGCFCLRRLTILFESIKNKIKLKSLKN